MMKREDFTIGLVMKVLVKEASEEVPTQVIYLAKSLETFLVIYLGEAAEGTEEGALEGGEQEMTSN